ncbi:MAG TPA: O-antigen ligase family protein [Blastocatellia bacterium]|nr:O-antigen ligase family protein [Blastocatellia bacterium]
MTRILDRVIVIGLLGAIVVAPWLFGSVEFYARHLLTVWLLVLLLLWNVKAMRERQWILQLTPIHGVLVAFVLVAVMQSLPLGPLLSRPSFPSIPDTRSLAEATSLSLDPATTRRTAVTLATLVGYFFLATHFLATRRRLLATVIVLILLGFSIALVGVIHKLTSNGKLLWFRDVEAIEIAFGPFVNRNHFAGFIEMILPLPLALIVAQGVARDKWILYGFLTVALGTALVLSASRGALVVLAAQLVALPVLSRWMSQQHGQRAEDASCSVAPRGRRFPRPTVRAAAGVVILVAGISLGVVWIGAEPVISRFSSANPDMRSQKDEAMTAATDTGESLSRPTIWRTTMRMIRDHPFLGVGLGAYPVAYTRYDEATGFYRVEQAHNDYLQIIAEAGVIGLLLLIAFMIAVGRAAGAALASPMVVERSLALGAALGCWGIAVHSLFDFNLQVPANALLFLLLVAILTILGSEKSPGVLTRSESRSI